MANHRIKTINRFIEKIERSGDFTVANWDSRFVRVFGMRTRCAYRCYVVCNPAIMLPPVVINMKMEDIL